MSLSFSKAKLIQYYADMNSHPPSEMVAKGTWEPMVVPQWVLDSEDTDVFAWGFTRLKNGHYGSAPLHRCARLVDGKYQHLDYEGPGALRAEITLIPRED